VGGRIDGVELHWWPNKQRSGETPWRLACFPHEWHGAGTGHRVDGWRPAFGLGLPSWAGFVGDFEGGTRL